jgi:hypothetical protein
MTDSVIIMIPKTYDPSCEAFRFALRKIRFVVAVFGPGLVEKRNAAGQSGPEGFMSLGATSSNCCSKDIQKRPLSRALRALWGEFSDSVRGRFASPQNEGFGKHGARKKVARRRS